ncbi:calcium-binding protein [Siccirubricoccus phaeus]|uniref:calcium-binding protein n=1 Tax=Siccirubricoccus phaeus TaxID=2595053 RepID=UPI0011F1D1BF|nr:calcium-binding protein [Siccirubricoccus phaeus]
MPTLGTSAADSLVGGADNDSLSGFESNDTLLGLGGDDFLIGGPGNDSLDGGSENDVLIDDTGSNTLLGGTGDDTVIAAALAYINAGEGNDSIFASGAGSSVQAGLGDDWIFLGAAATVSGGGGIDSFSLLSTFAYPGGTPAAPVIVTDFIAGAGGDRLDLVAWLAGPATAGFNGGNPFGGGGFLRLRQEGSDTVIDWDSTGGANGFAPLVRLQGVTAAALTAENLGFAPDGSEAGRQFLTGTAGHDSILAGAGDDYALGGAGNDTLSGSAGNDALYGEDGNDSLDGGSGANTLAGGTGEDTYIIRSAADVVVELPNQGQDTIRTTISLTLPGNIEILVLEIGAGALSGTGNGQADTLIGNESANTLDGGDGDDLLQGGPGADLLVGGAGDDTLMGGWASDMLAGGNGLDVLLGAIADAASGLMAGAGTVTFMSGLAVLGPRPDSTHLPPAAADDLFGTRQNPEDAALGAWAAGGAGDQAFV